MNGSTMGLPIRAHIKKMIAYYHEVEPFTLQHGKNYFAFIIFQNLENNFQKRPRYPKQEVNYNESLQLFIPQEYLKQNKVIMSYKHIVRINSLLSGVFQDKFTDYMDQTCKQKDDIQKGVEAFREMYDITEEDFSTDAMVKMYYRHRKKKQTLDKKNFRIKQKSS